MKATPRSLDDLTAEALHRRKQNLYAAHPIEAALHYHRVHPENPGEEGNGGLDFATAESLHRTGTQGIRLPQIPKLPESLHALSRLGKVDREGRRYLRRWVETEGPVWDETPFVRAWESQGCRGGAEHHVYHDQEKGRWYKRLYKDIHHSTLGDYFDRLRLHGILFPETAYRLEGFTINAKNKELHPVVSQPHVEVATDRPPVSREETHALMAEMGFASVQLRHEGIVDDGYYAYLHPQTGVLAYDLHEENVVRMDTTYDVAVIDPILSLARRGTWAALKLEEIGFPAPPDDEL